MVKSTPIHQLNMSQQAQKKEEINIDDIKEENDTNQQQIELQKQIDYLKNQIEITKQLNNKNSPEVVEQKPHSIIEDMLNDSPAQQCTPSSKTCKLASNDGILESLWKQFDYKLFLIVVVLAIFVFSSHIGEFVESKLEARSLTYLSLYIQSVILSVLVAFSYSYVNKN